jgi:hypothetical protein
VEILPDERQRIIAGPVDRMVKAGQLDHREYWAGDQFRQLYDAGRIGGHIQPNNFLRAGYRQSLATGVPDIFHSQAIADARIAWRQLEKTYAKDSFAFLVLKIALIEERRLEQIGHDLFHCADRREARAAARAAIKTALSDLSDRFNRLDVHLRKSDK